MYIVDVIRLLVRKYDLKAPMLLHTYAPHGLAKRVALRLESQRV